MIYSDVYGPILSTCLTCNIYYVLFIQDSFRNGGNLFMKIKDGVFSKFQEFKAHVENDENKKVEELRFKTKGEQESKDFNAIFRGAESRRS